MKVYTKSEFEKALGEIAGGRTVNVYTDEDQCPIRIAIEIGDDETPNEALADTPFAEFIGDCDDPIDVETAMEDGLGVESQIDLSKLFGTVAVFTDGHFMTGIQPDKLVNALDYLSIIQSVCADNPVVQEALGFLFEALGETTE